MKTFGNQTCFVSVNRTIRQIFSAKNPFTPYQVLGRMRWNKFPCAIAEKSIKFGGHGLSPFGVFQSLMNGGGLKGGMVKFSIEVEFLNRFVDVVFGASNDAFGRGWYWSCGGCSISGSR